jgi:hypothetical protein
MCLLRELSSQYLIGPELPKLTRAATEGGSSVVEHGQVELTKARGVGEYLDFDDLSVRDREAAGAVMRLSPSTKSG